MVKEWFKNFLSTTAITLIIIALYALFTGDETVQLHSILPSIVVNAVIHLGVLGLRKLNIENFLAETALELVFILGSVILTGYLVGWFRSTPVWVTVLIALGVFALGCLISVTQLNRDIDGINEDLRHRKELFGNDSA